MFGGSAACKEILARRVATLSAGSSRPKAARSVAPASEAQQVTLGCGTGLARRRQFKGAAQRCCHDPNPQSCPFHLLCRGCCHPPFARYAQAPGLPANAQHRRDCIGSPGSAWPSTPPTTPQTMDHRTARRAAHDPPHAPAAACPGGRPAPGRSCCRPVRPTCGAATPADRMGRCR